MSRQYIRRNVTAVSILLFIVIFCVIQLVSPAFLYEKDGSLRQFGLGTQKKTVIPIWFFTFILAILCYLFVLYYLAIPKFRY
jgi:amino acid transporter